MARIRSVKPEYFDDPDIGQLSAEAALVFIGIWTQADREGRLIDEPRRLKVRLRPFSSCDFDAILAELVDAGFLIRYQSEDGARLLQVRTFKKHQHIHAKEIESKLPAFCGNRDEYGTRTPVSSLLSLVSGCLESDGSSEPSSDDSDPAPALLVFPIIGRGAKTWPLTAEYVAELAGDYPGLDVLGECRSARAWCVANPNRQKTARGMPAFIVNWLNRAVKGGGQRLVQQPHRPAAQPAYTMDWSEECDRLHGGKCGGQFRHGLTMKAQAVSA